MTNLSIVIDRIRWGDIELNPCLDLERPNDSSDSRSKRQKSDEFLLDIQSSDIQKHSPMEDSSSKQLVSSDIDNKVSETIDAKIGDLKKMIAKIYALQKRTSDSTNRVSGLGRFTLHMSLGRHVFFNMYVLGNSATEKATDEHVKIIIFLFLFYFVEKQSAASTGCLRKFDSIDINRFQTGSL